MGGWMDGYKGLILAIAGKVPDAQSAERFKRKKRKRSSLILAFIREPRRVMFNMSI